MDESLRNALLRLVKIKFAGSPNIVSLAEDIVQDAYTRLRASADYAPEKENYGYLSVACMRQAYRKFIAQAVDFKRIYLDDTGTTVLDETDIAMELIQTEDAAAVLESLKTLRDIERVIVTQRYYGDLSFAQIAKENGLKLSTVLSHHRRALAKLRPKLTNTLGYGKEPYYEQNVMETGKNKRKIVE